MGDWRYAGGTRSANTFDADRFASTGSLGLSFFRNRAYDQETGRWTQEDPIGLAGGVNLYQFNGNNPVAYTDPFGLCPIPPTDCPPGYFTALGSALGGLLGGAGGGGGGFVLGFGIGAIPGGAAGTLKGAALGGAGGALVDGIVFASKQGRAVEMASSLVDVINSHIATVGGDPSADDAKHHRSEARGWVDRVEKYAKNMKGKTREAWLKRVADWRESLKAVTPE